MKIDEKPEYLQDICIIQEINKCGVVGRIRIDERN
jgi:hypothetical protein